MAPTDPDLQGQPAHRSPRLLLLVLLGGAIGAPLRYFITRAIPTSHDGWPTATFVINLSGAFLLGLLLELLRRSGQDRGVRRDLRLLIGTGLLGAFTTYSTLATETDLLIRDHRPGLAAGYCSATVILGIVLATAGIVVARGVPVWKPA